MINREKSGEAGLKPPQFQSFAHFAPFSQPVWRISSKTLQIKFNNVFFPIPKPMAIYYVNKRGIGGGGG